ncbi:GHKL domain-containing protein [bacterium]|nr:GHKL domain-containing protein [bacterium]
MWKSRRPPVEIEKNIKLTNQISLILFFVAAPYIYIFQFSGEPIIGWAVVPTVTLFAATVVLNYFGHYRLSRYLLVINASFSTFFFAAKFGRQSGIQLLYLAFSTFPLVIFKVTETKETFFSVLLPMACLAILELSNYSLLEQIQVNDDYRTIIYWTAIAVVPTIIVVCIRYYAILNFRAESELESKNQALTESIDALAKSNDRLNTAYDEIKQARAAAERSAQLAAYATLTRGIAHEIRNPVAMARSGAEIFADPDIDLVTKEEFARCIIENLDRTLDIVSTMLKFGGAKAENKQRLQINHLIESSALLSKTRCVNAGVALHMNLERVPEIEADPGALQQILTNLILNAVEAMEDAPQLRPHHLTIHSYFKESETHASVAIEITDTGPGISKTDQGRVFDSFYTTKHDNQGLGLSMVMRLVEDHGGTVEIESNPDVTPGTTVRLELPV